MKLEEQSSRVTIRKAANAFVEDAESRSAKEAAYMNRLMTDEFVATVTKTYIDEVSREDVLRFHTTLRKRGLSDRTIANKDARLRSFLRFCKVSVADVMPPKPKYESKLPAIYATEDIRSLLNAADDYMRLVIEVGLKCGLREQELMHLEWSDIDPRNGVLRVVGKPHVGFKVKDTEQRELPVPKDLLDKLATWHKANTESRWVFPTASGRPNTKLLRTLKRLAKRAGLNCNACEGCRSSLGECRQWRLHTLRRTYGTTLLRNGVDLVTVQRLLGHSDLESTMRYLRPSMTAESQAAINAIQWI